jgi:hypothetical protein
LLADAIGYWRMNRAGGCSRGAVGHPLSEPGLMRAWLSFTGWVPSAPAPVGEPGTGGIPVAIEANFGSGCGVVAMSEAYSNEACSLFTRVVSHPVAMRQMTAAVRKYAADLIILRKIST